MMLNVLMFIRRPITCFLSISKITINSKEAVWNANKSLFSQTSASQVRVKYLPKNLHEAVNKSFKVNCSQNAASNTVYNGILSRQIKLVKAFSLSTSAIGIALQPVVLSKMWASSVFAAVSIGVFSSFFIIGTPVMLNWIAKRYVTKLNMNPESKEFSATVLTFLNREKMIDFKATDVVVPEVPSFLATFNAKGHPLFVDSRHFTDISAYKHLMGYDKPIDYHLHKSENQNNVKK